MGILAAGHAPGQAGWPAAAAEGPVPVGPYPFRCRFALRLASPLPEDVSGGFTINRRSLYKAWASLQNIKMLQYISENIGCKITQIYACSSNDGCFLFLTRLLNAIHCISHLGEKACNIITKTVAWPGSARWANRLSIGPVPV